MKKIVIIGNLGQDALTRQTATGKTFYSFSVAVTEKYSNQRGEEIEETMWFDCLTANTKIAQYLKKGKKVYIEGNPKVNKYHSEKTGEFEAKITINTTIIRLLSPNDQPKAQSPTPPTAQAKAKEEQAKEQGEQASQEPIIDDDLPF
jgi:single-strand DNA-binding protein